MNYVTLAGETRATTLDALRKVQEINGKIAKLKKESGMYSKEYMYEQMQKYAGEKARIEAEAKGIFGTQSQKYYQEHRENFRVKGEEITPDANLLNSPLALSSHDLDALFDKHAGNYTMQRMIYEYGQTTGNVVSRKFNPEEKLNDDIRALEAFQNNVFARPEYADIWTDENYFKENICEYI